MSNNRPDSIEKCIADITECPICNDVLRDNRCLPCLHTFCLKCLESYKRKNSKGKSLSCPVCRREYSITKCTADLSRNFFIDKLIDAHKIKKQEVLSKNCEICSEDKKIVPATRYCCDCQQNLCLSCERQHKKIKATTTHQIIDNTSVADRQELAPRPTYCVAHRKKEAEVYCQDCKMVICWECKSVSHNSHTSIKINCAAKDLAVKLEEHIEQISKHLRTKQDDFLKLAEQEKLYTHDIDAELANICKELNKLYRNITDNADRLKKALSASTAVHLEKFSWLRDKLDSDISKLKNHRFYVEQMMHLGNVSDLCEYTDKLISETARMMSENTCTIIVPPVTHLSDLDLQDHLIGRRMDTDKQYQRFNNREQLQRDPNHDIFDKEKDNPEDKTARYGSHEEPKSESSLNDETGTPDVAVDKRKSVVDKVCYPLESTETTAVKKVSNSVKTTVGPSSKYKWSLLRTISFENGGAACGITILNSNIYIVFQSSNHVHVYDSAVFVFRRSFQVDGLVNPNDMASCKFNRCLYICDWGTPRVFRVTTGDRMEQIDWSIDTDLGGISVTADHHVLLAGYVSNKLKEYNTMGKLMRSINLEANFKPWHAIKLVSNDYLICQGNSRPIHVGEYHRVCLIDGNGKIKTSFGGVKGSEKEQLHGPYHLAVREDGRILVTDCNNRRILLLSPTLKFVKELIPSSENVLRRARRMHLDEVAGRLYVADNAAAGYEIKDGRILIFSIPLL